MSSTEGKDTSLLLGREGETGAPSPENPENKDSYQTLVKRELTRDKHPDLLSPAEKVAVEISAHYGNPNASKEITSQFTKATQETYRKFGIDADTEKNFTLKELSPETFREYTSATLGLKDLESRRDPETNLLPPKLEAARQLLQATVNKCSAEFAGLKNLYELNDTVDYGPPNFRRERHQKLEAKMEQMGVNISLNEFQETCTELKAEYSLKKSFEDDSSNRKDIKPGNQTETSSQGGKEQKSSKGGGLTHSRGRPPSVNEQRKRRGLFNNISNLSARKENSANISTGGTGNPNTQVRSSNGSNHPLLNWNQ